MDWRKQLSKYHEERRCSSTVSTDRDVPRVLDTSNRQQASCNLSVSKFLQAVAVDFGLITCAKSDPSNCAKTRAADMRDVLVARGRAHCNACLIVYAVATR